MLLMMASGWNTRFSKINKIIYLWFPEFCMFWFLLLLCTQYFFTGFGAVQAAYSSIENRHWPSSSHPLPRSQRLITWGGPEGRGGNTGGGRWHPSWKVAHCHHTGDHLQDKLDDPDWLTSNGAEPQSWASSRMHFSSTNSKWPRSPLGQSWKA